MSALRPAPLVLTLPVLALLAGSCKGGSSGQGSAIDARMPGPAMTAFERQPGFVEGGLVYIAVRPGRLQKWLQSLPVPPELAGDLAEAGRELGVDPRSDDVLGHLGIDANAVVSMTLARPMVEGGEPLFEAIAGLPPPKSDPFPGVDDQVLPGDLAAKAHGIGVHFRFHVPVAAPEKLKAQLAKIPPARATSGPLCEALRPHELCAGDREGLLLARSEGGALITDLFLFPIATGDGDDAERKASVEAALRARPAADPELASLRGDFAAFVDAAAIGGLADIKALDDLVGMRRWVDAGSYLEDVERQREERRGALRLRETRRLLRGIRYEAAIGEEAIRATLQWVPTDDGASKALADIFAHKGPALEAPTLDGLCADAVVCGRTTGLPSLGALGELATGIYAGPQRELDRALKRADEIGGLVLFLETWPNFLGAVQRWPQEEARGPEAAIIGSLMSSIANFGGMGGSLRSLQIDRNARRPALDFVAYVRGTAQEIGMLRGFMVMGQLRVDPLTLQNVDARVETAAIPDSDVPAALFLATDPRTVRVGDRDVETGWIAVADAPDRLSWLLGLPRDRAIEPAAYFEIPDLLRLLSAIPDVERELGNVRAYVGGRSVRFAVDVIDGRPRIDTFFGRIPAKSP